MSIRLSTNGKWRIGNGKAIYSSKAMAMSALRMQMFSRNKPPMPQ